MALGVRIASLATIDRELKKFSRLEVDAKSLSRSRLVQRLRLGQLVGDAIQRRRWLAVN